MAIDWQKIVEYLTTDTSKPKTSIPAKTPTSPTQSTPPSQSSSSPSVPTTPTPSSSPSPITAVIPQTPSTTIEKIDLSASTGTKKMGSFMVLFILVNSIFGTSLFYLPSIGVLAFGPASILSWLVLFFFATIIMLYMSELITTYPTSGGTYEFCKLAYGRFGSFMGGWVIWLAGNLGMALNVQAAAEYFLPSAAVTSVARIIFVILWIIVLNALAFKGVDAGATMLVVFGIIATLVLFLMTIPSFISIPGLLESRLDVPFQKSFLIPFFQQQGLWSILAYFGLSLLYITEAFFGYETISYMANEVAQPKKIPKLLIITIITCGIATSLYVLSSLGTVSYHDYVNDARPFIVQAKNVMGTIGAKIVEFGMYLVIIGAAAGWPITGSRLLQAMAQDKLFPPQFGEPHKKFNTPYKAVIFQCIAVFFFWGMLIWGYTHKWNNTYLRLYLIYVVWGLISLSLILLAVPILRRKHPDKERSFKAPLPWLGPIFIITYIFILLINWYFIEGVIATATLRIGLSFLLLGLPLYLLVEMTYNPSAILKANEYLSYLVLIGEKIFFPYSIRNTLLNDMGDITGKKIFEYGSSMGTLTNKLAEKVGPSGKIYGADISLHKVKIAQDKTKHHPHVQIIHHPHLDDLRLTLPEKVDGVISVGMLSYMQNPQKILTSLANHVQPGGEIVFLDYDKFFYVIPNVPWMSSDKNLITMFANAGFDVQIERKNSILWQYIIISGKRRE